jgi:hypothetical protein
MFALEFSFRLAKPLKRMIYDGKQALFDVFL